MGLLGHLGGDGPQGSAQEPDRHIDHHHALDKADGAAQTVVQGIDDRHLGYQVQRVGDKEPGNEQQQKDDGEEDAPGQLPSHGRGGLGGLLGVGAEVGVP